MLTEFAVPNKIIHNGRVLKSNQSDAGCSGDYNYGGLYFSYFSNDVLYPDIYIADEFEYFNTLFNSVNLESHRKAVIFAPYDLIDLISKRELDFNGAPDVVFYKFSTVSDFDVDLYTAPSGFQGLLISLPNYSYLSKSIYSICNAVYRMGRWYWDKSQSGLSENRDQTRFPLDLLEDCSPYYSRAERLRADMQCFGISKAAILYRDNVFSPNKIFFKDRIERPVFAFNRHVSCSEDYILTRLDSHQIYGCQNFRKIQSKVIQKNLNFFWRGNPMGCINYSDGWAFHFSDFAKNNAVDASFRKALLLSFPRFSLCLKYYDVEGFDVGFSSKILGYEFLEKPKVTLETANESLFQLCVEGNDLPSALPWQMINGNVVLMPEVRFQPVFTFGLLPYIHYIPIRNDFEFLSDLRTQLINSIDRCHEIAANAINYMTPFADESLQVYIEKIVFMRYKLLNSQQDYV